MNRRIVIVLTVAAVVLAAFTISCGSIQCNADGGEVMVHVMSGRDICDVNRNGRFDYEGPDYFL